MNGAATPAGVLHALAAATGADPDRWPARDQWQPGADVDGLTDGDWLCVLPPAWAQITGRPGGAVLAVLYDRGDLATPPGNRAKGQWTTYGPRWAGRPSVYRVRRAAIADPPADPPAGAPVVPGPHVARSTSGPWAPAPARELTAEDCPECGGPAVRTPQGTLTDCPACGLVLTAGCRDRIAKGERQRAPREVAARPDVAAVFAAQLAAETHKRNRERSEAACQQWAAALDAPDIGTAAGADVADEAAQLANGFRAAGGMMADAETPAALAEMVARVFRPLLDAARPVWDDIREARRELAAREADGYPEDDLYDEDPEDDDEDDDLADEDDDDEDGDLYGDRFEDQDHGQPPVPPVPVCDWCGITPAIARIDAAEPGHRLALGGRLPADTCRTCAAQPAGAAARMTYARLTFPREYAPGAGAMILSDAEATATAIASAVQAGAVQLMPTARQPAIWLPPARKPTGPRGRR